MKGDGSSADPRLVAVTAGSLAVAIAAVVYAWRSGGETGVWPEAARREVERLVAERYVDPVGAARADRLFDAAMRGYVEELDPFSRYFTAEEKKTLDEDTSGKFGGIGVRAEAAPQGLLISAVRTGGPADEAGIEPGDTVERAGGVPLAGRSRDAMIEMVKGDPGTTIDLVLRPAAGGDVRQLSVTRAIVESDSVTAVRMLDGEPRTGYLRIAQFTDTTADETRDGLAKLRVGRAASIVLDLRHNLGGVVQTAVEVASAFLPEGTVVCEVRSREGGRRYETRATPGFSPLTVPLVVLVDGASASASEILAGALQDHGRAVLVGDRTYGKFVMQTLLPLAERGALLRLTTARYLTPRGRGDQRDPAHGKLGGLMPDVRVPLRTDAELDELRDVFGRETGPAWRVLPGRVVRTAPDRQLAAALDLLRGGSAPAEPVMPRTQ